MTRKSLAFYAYQPMSFPLVLTDNHIPFRHSRTVGWIEKSL
jgi:hypothetical protein